MLNDYSRATKPPREHFSSRLNFRDQFSVNGLKWSLWFEGSLIQLIGETVTLLRASTVIQKFSTLNIKEVAYTIYSYL